MNAALRDAMIKENPALGRCPQLPPGLAAHRNSALLPHPASAQ